MVNLAEMRRFALIAILGLIASSFDCYGVWVMSKQARDCCNSGHCSPANHDPCCKTAPSGTNQYLVKQQNVHLSARHSTSADVVAIPFRNLDHNIAITWQVVHAQFPPHACSRGTPKFKALSRRRRGRTQTNRDCGTVADPI